LKHHSIYHSFMQPSLSHSSKGSGKRPRLDTPALASQSKEEIQSSAAKSDSDSDSDFVKPKRQYKKRKKQQESEEVDLTDDPEEQDEPSPVSSSRYAKKGTKSMLNTLSKFTIGKLQGFALNRLTRGKRLEYLGDLTLALVIANPVLDRFVCWSASGSGLKLKSSGGQFNKAASIQIGLQNQQDEYGRWVDTKNIKMQAHKVALVKKMGINYNELEPMGMETSHLCNSITGCWRPDHLTPETHAQNVARNSQFGCPGWFFYLDTQTLTCFCAHTPRCEFVRIMPSVTGYGDNPLPTVPSVPTSTVGILP
jgi:hypothetical protein